MNRYNVLSAIALLALTVLVPVYAAREPARREAAQLRFRRQLLDEGSALYVQHCATCHGPAGEGSGAIPQLNNPALRSASGERLFDAIARATHGSNISAWHLSSGGTLTAYQVEALVALIHFPQWEQIGRLSRQAGVVAVETTAESKNDNPLVTAQWLNGASPWTQTTQAGATGEDAHRCAACHEEPAIHAERFGLDCARCHTLEAWEPALLTQHTFQLDHGGKGQVSCQTCHRSNYYEHDCYGCHDHRPEQMAEFHLAEGIEAYKTCHTCHPTGREGEGELMMALNRLRPEGIDGQEAAPGNPAASGMNREDDVGSQDETVNTGQREGPAYHEQKGR